MKTRHLLSGVLLLVTGLVAATVPATTASAQQQLNPPGYGYVWGNQPSTASYYPSTGYELNSTGGDIHIRRRATGHYYVRFQGMGQAGGVAHASAYGSNHRCALQTYYQAGADELLYVRCFDIDGNPVDTRFIANFTTVAPAGVAYGWLRNDNPVPGILGYVPPAAYSHDGAGQEVRVFRGSVGVYQVQLGAFAQDVASGVWRDGFLAATVHGSADVTCYPNGSMPGPASHRIRVSCADLDGQPADTQFTLTYARDANLLGTAARVSVMAHGPDAPVVDGWTNPAGGAPTVTELGTGYFRVLFPNQAAPRGHAYATLMNTQPMFCNVWAWWPVGTSQQVLFRCFDPAIGEPHPVANITVGFLP